jgi:hypothetical protein
MGGGGASRIRRERIPVVGEGSVFSLRELNGGGGKRSGISRGVELDEVDENEYLAKAR